jgi:hypothetical protein
MSLSTMRSCNVHRAPIWPSLSGNSRTYQYRNCEWSCESSFTDQIVGSFVRTLAPASIRSERASRTMSVSAKEAVAVGQATYRGPNGHVDEVLKTDTALACKA